MVRVRVPATTANLGPGFDCLGMALSLYNYIEIEESGAGETVIKCSGNAATSDIALDETNLVYRAAAAVFGRVGRKPSGLQLRLELEAPLARGLGSSASAIVGGMFAANELLGRPLDQTELALEVTRMEGHPDNVVPCLFGGLTASVVLGDRILFERVLPSDNLRFVVFVPDYELETSKARGVMPKEVSMKDAVFNGSRIPFVIARLQTGNISDLRQIMEDRLHQPYRIPLIKGYNNVEAAAIAAGAAAVCISGAGPTILAVCEAIAADDVARAGKAALSDVNVGCEAHILLPDVHGCVVQN